MHRLDVAPEQHFAQADYAGSEVLIYRWDAEAGQVLMCCQDLSEKIANWAYGAERPDYASRYRIFCFHDVSGYHRSGAQKSWQSSQDDFFIIRDDRRIPIDDISVSETEDARTVTISFELGFGEVGFSCREVTISELTTRAASRHDGLRQGVVDAENGIPFDEDEFLSGLYGVGSGGNEDPI